ncbi:Nif3-like dinuclear metal center hexameric protein [Curvibacter sp. APW13]|uniref:Nif3-like dinuclear metal center hexameric protein n=1 Tax=Curvibacter sp. APW13 TaxID=3077236 RepID=UPI0028DDE7B4|nr:Nif3-like dinuclear metal center hexameric protein [Curvibacter sp. APW13]MDT8989547.1 Nif3-like dinuclear metal center hexameric protein [Curvibacter sp. APW13]
MILQRTELCAHLHTLLEVDKFKDYCPNGLQVEGRDRVRRVVSGVTASQALIEQAIVLGADTILVHHGLFWRGHDGRVTGWMRKRLGLLLQHDINLLAYHLPLDAHPQWGNNVQLGARLGLVADTRFGEQQLGFLGRPHADLFHPDTEGLQRAADGTLQFAGAQSLASHVTQVMGRQSLLVEGHPGPIDRIAWCTGGAQGYFEAAIAAGAQAFITGEISEPQAHYARECGVAYIACGHHASERYGVQALGEYLASQWGVEHQFVDIDNPA